MLQYRFILLTVGLLVGLASMANAATVNLTWNANTESAKSTSVVKQIYLKKQTVLLRGACDG